MITIQNKENAKSCWVWFKNHTDLSDIAIAALLGNFWAESAFLPNNLENRVNNQQHITDAEYCERVNNGKYRYGSWGGCRDSFCRDAAGFGLAQWTYWTRKAALYDATVEKGIPVEDLEAQCAFAWEELKNQYLSVYNVLKSSEDIRTCTEKVLVSYENPAVQSNDVKNLRTKYAQEIYEAFHNEATTTTTAEKSRAEQLIDEIQAELEELRRIVNNGD